MQQQSGKNQQQGKRPDSQRQNRQVADARQSLAKKRSDLDPCFSAGRRRARGDPAPAASRDCHPTILSHRMFHRHPSLSIDHFHFPSLSDSNPFPWLDEASSPGGHQRRRRRESVFLSDSDIGGWDSLIERHLCCGSKARRNNRAAGAAVHDCLAEEELEGEDCCEDDDVFQQQQQQQQQQPPLQQKHAQKLKCMYQQQQQQQHQQDHQHQEKHRRRLSRLRDPRWRESIAEAVRREFDPVASRRAHQAALRVPVEPPPVARRRLHRLLGDAGAGPALLCDREFAERLAFAIAEHRRSEAREREKQLAEIERLRLLKLL